MKNLLFIVGSCLLAATLAAAPSTETGGRGVLIHHPNAIANSYIVRFIHSVESSAVEPLVRELADEHVFQVTRLGGQDAIFRYALKGSQLR